MYQNAINGDDSQIDKQRMKQRHHKESTLGTMDLDDGT